mmetsp:Transcript_5726/g.16982  ORF Transcript_5726/g.16982 Transcript_5726/m.16982 type:complete len:337 (-) Transcript_5726:5305-6315(-)
MRDLFQNMILVPQSLHDHLAQLHGRQCRLQPTVAADDVDDGLDQLHGSREDFLLVRSQVGRHGLPAEVALEQHKRFGMGVELTVWDFVRLRSCQHLDRLLLAKAQRQRPEFPCSRENLEDASDLGFLRYRRGNDIDGSVLDVIVRGDHAQVEGGDVAFVGHLAAATGLEVADHSLHHLTQVFADILVGRALQPVIGRIFGEATVQERPREVVDSVLHGFDGLCDHFRDEWIVQVAVQVAFHWKRFVEELLQRLLFGLVAHDDALSAFVRLVAAQHVEQVHDAVVHMGLFAAVVRFGSHDDYKMSQALDLPAHVSRADQDLDGAIVEQFGHFVQVGL